MKKKGHIHTYKQLRPSQSHDANYTLDLLPDVLVNVQRRLQSGIYREALSRPLERVCTRRPYRRASARCIRASVSSASTGSPPPCDESSKLTVRQLLLPLKDPGVQGEESRSSTLRALPRLAQRGFSSTNIFIHQSPRSSNPIQSIKTSQPTSFHGLVVPDSQPGGRLSHQLRARVPHIVSGDFRWIPHRRWKTRIIISACFRTGD